jgi:hypothetical protein
MNKNRPYECGNVIRPASFSRRDLLKSAGIGFGYLAFAGLSANAAPAYQSPLLPKTPAMSAKAKRVILLSMQGGPSHVDTFDYKPKLIADAGKGKLIAPAFPFHQHGKSGLWMADVFPHLAQQADEMCLIRSMRTDIPAHLQAFAQLHTGSTRFTRPSLGAWTLYGLGTVNQNLPGFITINPGKGGAINYGSAFLPASYQGTPISVGGGNRNALAANAGIGNIHNSLLSEGAQRSQIDLMQAMNRDQFARDATNPEIEGMIQSYELAFRMQTEAPKAMDFSKESAATLQMYGVGTAGDDFARQCLMARRFAEAGVRFIELGHPGWDQHANLKEKISQNCRAIDQPIAALIADLKQRDMLKDTLIIWGGEFGRTPESGKPDGRGHNAKGYTMWMAGGGVKAGLSYGNTDDHGGIAVENPVHVHDLHATILALLGLDHERLTYRYAGRDYRLTDVYGKVVKDIIA